MFDDLLGIVFWGVIWTWAAVVVWVVVLVVRRGIERQCRRCWKPVRDGWYTREGSERRLVYCSINCAHLDGESEGAIIYHREESDAGAMD